MTYDLYIGDRRFSTWSMRGWLMLRAFDIPHNTHLIGLYSGTMADDLAHMPLARLVPALNTPHGHTQDSLAMAEYLHEQHPDKGLWPRDPAQRMRARWLVSELHSGFSHLRGDCPGDLLGQMPNFKPSEGVLKDVARIQDLWASSFDMSGSDGWLFGEYSIADVFYAPIAGRIATYNLPMSDRAAAYVEKHLSDPLFRQWRALGLTKSYDPQPYYPDMTRGTWPGPARLDAKPVDSGPSENATCPYSGNPVAHYLELDGRTFGFCNPTCRDKTVIDAEAWPAFMDIYHS